MELPGHHVWEPRSVVSRVWDHAKIIIEGAGKLLNQSWIRVDGGGGLPLSDRLGQQGPLAHFGRSLKCTDEIRHKLSSIVLRQDV